MMAVTLVKQCEMDAIESHEDPLMYDQGGAIRILNHYVKCQLQA